MQPNTNSSQTCQVHQGSRTKLSPESPPVSGTSQGQFLKPLAQNMNKYMGRTFIGQPM